MSYSSRFWLYAPLALFLGLAIWVMSHWWIVARDMDGRLNALNGRQAVPGVRISWTKQTISGFPFRIDVVFENFRADAEAPRGLISWRSDRFALHALTYGRAQQIFEAAGRQSLAWTDADGGKHSLSFLPGSLRASAIADARGVARFDLDMQGASGKDSGGANFTIGRTQLHMRRDPGGDALDLVLSAAEVKDAGTPFGDHIRKLDIYNQISQGSAFSRLLAGQSGWMDAIMAWRHRGGEIRTGTVDIESAALTAKSAGPELQPRLRALLFPFY